MSEGYVVDFPTLGDLHEAWARQHCVVPQGHRRGTPYVMADWQFWCSAKHYAIRPGIDWDPDDPPRNQAFVFRRSQIIGPQKTGKGPMAATFTAFEAVGPSQFCGWAEPGDGYACVDWGCSCGWEYSYLPGEPMGMRHPSPTIQLTATSQDQVDNTLTPLRYMIQRGPLGDILLDREEFIRIIGDEDDPDLDRIDAVTSAANSKLGNPISFAVQDETGIWTKTNKMMAVADTQRRGLAGMGGRSMETTNCWDPAEASVAQRSFESRRPDIFRFYRIPPAVLRWSEKRDRRKILEYVYEGSWWVNLDSIEAEAMEIAETDPAQAERFFGNRLIQGAGKWLPDEVWPTAFAASESGQGMFHLPEPAPGTPVCLGFDGSENNDWTAIRAETYDGYLFTPRFGPDSALSIWNPDENGGKIPRAEVNVALAEIVERFPLGRLYADPQDWYSEIGDWALEFGEEHVSEWPTNKIARMYDAIKRFETDIVSGRTSHDGCPVTAIHMANARKVPKPRQMYVLGKPAGADHQKIDAAMASILAHEAAADARAAGWGTPTDTSLFHFGSHLRNSQSQSRVVANDTKRRRHGSIFG